MMPVLPEQRTPHLHLDTSVIQFKSSPSPTASQFHVNSDMNIGGSGSAVNVYNRRNNAGASKKVHLNPSTIEKMQQPIYIHLCSIINLVNLIWRTCRQLFHTNTCSTYSTHF